MSNASTAPTRTGGFQKQTGGRKSTTTKRITDRSAMGRMGDELSVIRESGPEITLQHLRRLEAIGQITFDESNPSVAVDDMDFLPSADVEISLEDEDLNQGEPWGEASENGISFSLLGTTCEEKELNPYPSDVYRLIIDDGNCSFTPPAWAYRYTGVTRDGAAKMYELSSRYRTFIGLTNWLNTNRQAFLKSQDLLDLGPLTLNELSNDGAAVIQEQLLGMLRLSPTVSGESFSRFLNQCDLAWSDGSVPIRFLFSKEAKMAWVAQSVILFAKHFGQRLTEKTLANSQHVQVSRKKGKQVKSQGHDLTALDFPSFVELTNAMARTRWQDVLLVYRERMLQA